jgi:hypothetical protein
MYVCIAIYVAIFLYYIMYMGCDLGTHTIGGGLCGRKM